MGTKLLKKSGILLSLLLAVSVFGAFTSFVSSKNNTFQEVEAASHPANYASYTYSGSYYNGLGNNLTNGMEGTLRSGLTTLIHPTSVPTYSGTGNSNQLSSVLQYADEDPTNSNNMVYLYTRDSVTKNAAQSWNREHVWPKSLSNSCWTESRAGTDLLHLRPTYSDTNSKRGNLLYGEITGGESLTYSNIFYGYKNTTYFMPLDSVKGDVARIIMYVWVAYHDEYGSKLPNITNVFQSFDVLMSWHVSDKPDVMEGNRNNYSQNTSMQKNRNPFVDHPEYAWKIFGSQCSSSVYNAAQAAYPDGGVTPTPTADVTISKTSASLTVGETTTIYATSTDSSTITWSTGNVNIASISSTSASSGTNITITGVATGSTTITAKATIGGTLYSKTCTVAVTSSGGGGGGDTPPSGDSYTIYNTDVASGSYPTTETSYTTADGLNFKACNVGCFDESTVQFKKSGGYLCNSNELNLSSISINNLSKGSLTVYGGTSAHPTTTSITGTNGVYNLSGYSYFTVQNNTSNVANCASITITLAEKTLSSIAVKTAPTKTTYIEGQCFDPTGLSLTLTYSDSSTSTLTYAGNESDFEFVPDLTTGLDVEHEYVTIYYGEESCNQNITVNARALSSISLSNKKTAYYVGDTFVKPTVTAHYSNGVEEDITAYATATGYNMSSSGQQQVTISYTYLGVTKTSSYSITVTALVVTSIQLSNIKTNYFVGDSFVKPTVTGTYNSGASAGNVTNDSSFTGYNMNVAGNYQVTVTCGNAQTSFNITVSAIVVDHISVSGQQTQFNLNDLFAFGGTVTAYYNNETSIDVTSSATFEGYDMSSTGVQTVTVRAAGDWTTYEITIIDPDAVNPTPDENINLTLGSPYMNGVPYLMYFYSTNKGNNYYFAGSMSGYYGATTTTISSATLVYFEESGDGQNIYFMSNGKQYLSVVRSGTYYNFSYSSTEEPSTKWKFASTSDYECMTFDVDGVPYTFGAYDTKPSFGTINLNQHKNDYELQFITANDSGVTGLATIFNDYVGCYSKGTQAPIFVTGFSWSDFADAYKYLNAANKTTLRTIVKNESGNEIEQMVARYDYILSKYGTSTYSNFLERSVTPLVNNGSFVLSEIHNDSVGMIIVVISIAAISLGAFYVFIKRKRSFKK